MNKKDISFENGLRDIFDRLSKNMSDEDGANPLFKYLCEKFEYFESAEEFDAMAIHPISRVFRTFVVAKIGEGLPLSASIYTNYNFYESHVAGICARLYGSACGVDKARHLLRCAMDWERTGVLPVFDFTEKYAYHYPSTGTPLQWMEFTRGLMGLLHGKPDAYLQSFHDLVSAIKKCVWRSRGDTPDSGFTTSCGEVVVPTIPTSRCKCGNPLEIRYE